MNFILDKSKWICGRPSSNIPPERSNCLGEGSTKLLNEKGYMCCLGQCMYQVIEGHNKSVSVLFDKESPEETDFLCPPFNKLYGSIVNTRLAGDAMFINDAIDTTVDEKIELLQQLFTDHGHTLEVVESSDIFKNI